MGILSLVVVEKWRQTGDTAVTISPKASADRHRMIRLCPKEFRAHHGLESMKTVYLLRHAKSSWSEPHEADHERPLNRRGRKAAKAMGLYLYGLLSPPGLVLASTARRVSETLDRIQRPFSQPMPVQWDLCLYLATADHLLLRLLSTSSNTDSVLIIAHNPGLHELAVKLSGEVADAAAYGARPRLKDKYPTGALTVISFPDCRSWRSVGYGKGSLMSFITPRELLG